MNNEEIKNVCPPWTTDEDISPYSIVWRMGGEKYMFKFIKHIENLSLENKKKIVDQFPTNNPEWNEWINKVIFKQEINEV